jgi:hypothetical protein
MLWKNWLDAAMVMLLSVLARMLSAVAHTEGYGAG